MNHDCMLSSDCMQALVTASNGLGRYALHARLNYLDKPSEIWWSGSYVGFKGTQSIDSVRVSPNNKVTHNLIPTSSTMGQCLLLHSTLVNPKFLCANMLPHYFSDSVQTTLMRRCGADLFVVYDAIAYTDQSDEDRKNEYLCSPLIYLPRVLFSPGQINLIAFFKHLLRLIVN